MEKKKSLTYLIVAFLLLLAGYGSTFSATKFEILTPTTVPSLSPQIREISKVKVLRVIDGDTIEIEGGVKVRFIGMDTPEMNTSGIKGCFAAEAKTETEKMLTGKEITLEKDVSETDKYGRILRYVYANGEFINNRLVKEGFARVATFPPDVKFQQEFLDSETYARNHNLGLWGKCRSNF